MSNQFRLWVALATFVLTTTTAGAAQPTSLPAKDRAAAKQLADEFRDRLARSRYMESKDARDVVVPGWEGFPTRRYTYTVKDRDGTAKKADVVMLDASADRIAEWIVAALVEVRGDYSIDDGRKLFAHIIGQSGGQFPVAGVVYEDIIPADGVNEIYCFRDGVTVEIEGVPHRGTAPMTPQQVETSVNGKVKRVFTYARVASTSPKMWIDAAHAKDVVGDDGKPNERWLDEVRKAYQAAWDLPRNELIVAWLKADGRVIAPAPAARPPATARAPS